MKGLAHSPCSLSRVCVGVGSAADRAMRLILLLGHHVGWPRAEIGKTKNNNTQIVNKFRTATVHSHVFTTCVSKVKREVLPCLQPRKLTVAYRKAESSPASSSGMSVTSLRSAQRPTTRVQSAATEEEGLFLKILALVVLAVATRASLRNLSFLLRTPCVNSENVTVVMR